MGDTILDAVVHFKLDSPMEPRRLQSIIHTVEAFTAIPFRQQGINLSMAPYWEVYPAFSDPPHIRLLHSKVRVTQQRT